MKLKICAFLLLISRVVLAEPNWIYKVDVHDIEREAKHALVQVVDRLTPGHNDHDNPMINTTRPDDYIGHVTTKKTGLFTIEFDSFKIQQLMKSAGLKPWPDKPKLSTFVLSLNYPYYKCLLPHDDKALFAAIEQSARSKGLTLNYTCPKNTKAIYRLDDVNQHWTPDFITKIAHISQDEGILLLKIHRDKGNHQTPLEGADLSYKGHVSGRTQWFNFSKKQPFLQPLFGMSEFLFNITNPNIDTISQVDVRVHNIQNSRDFSDVEAYLTSIPGILNISLNSVTADAVLYTLDSIISRELLNMRLANKYQAMPMKAGEKIFNYRLIV
tara:strand:+ start:1782 stop:2762 length:981 start_codon:yes stop_codon:yes gene_type:complete